MNYFFFTSFFSGKNSILADNTSKQIHARKNRKWTWARHNVYFVNWNGNEHRKCDSTTDNAYKYNGNHNHVQSRYTVPSLRKIKQPLYISILVTFSFRSVSIHFSENLAFVLFGCIVWLSQYLYDSRLQTNSQIHSNSKWQSCELNWFEFDFLLLLLLYFSSSYYFHFDSFFINRFSDTNKREKSK